MMRYVVRLSDRRGERKRNDGRNACHGAHGKRYAAVVRDCWQGWAGLTRGLCGCGLALVTAYWLSKIVEYTILTLLSTCLVYAPTCHASWPCNTHPLDAAAWWLVSLPTSTCS